MQQQEVEKLPCTTLKVRISAKEEKKNLLAHVRNKSAG
jgi:hypothetical protein